MEKPLGKHEGAPSKPAGLAECSEPLQASGDLHSMIELYMVKLPRSRTGDNAPGLVMHPPNYRFNIPGKEKEIRVTTRNPLSIYALHTFSCLRSSWSR